MQSLVADRNLTDRFVIDSAGTASYHTGRLPDSRMIAAGAKRGLSLTSLAKTFTAEHATQRDLVVAMDRDNAAEICRISNRKPSNLKLLSDFLDESWPRDVPDPYYGGEAGFEYVLDMLYAACPRIIAYSAM